MQSLVCGQKTFEELRLVGVGKAFRDMADGLAPGPDGFEAATFRRIPAIFDLLRNFLVIYYALAPFLPPC